MNQISQIAMALLFNPMFMWNQNIISIPGNNWDPKWDPKWDPLGGTFGEAESIYEKEKKSNESRSIAPFGKILSGSNI